MLRWVLGCLAAICLVSSAVAAPLARTDNVEVELVSDHASIAPGQTIYVALRQKIRAGWHTYWRNPGDSGEPTEIAWTLPRGFSAGDIIWPTPRRLPVGPLVNYGFEGEILLPSPVTAPADLVVGAPVTVTAAARWLVCADICIPEEATLTLMLATAGARLTNPAWRARIDAARSATARPAPWKSAVARESSGGVLSLASPDLARAAGSGALRGVYFFPFDPAMVNHAMAQPVAFGPQGLTVFLPPAPNSLIGSTPLEGWLVTTDAAGRDTAYAVSAQPGPAFAGTRDRPLASAAKAAADGGGSGGTALLGFAAAVAFAVLGGLILNLMPCVFPILSVKALSIAGLAHAARAKAVSEAWAFAVGVMVAFLALAGALIAFKAAGAVTGWGFQLQSPIVVAGLALLFIVIGLSLLGLFELGGGLQNLGAGLADRGGVVGAFFTGALAVVVASPCTAPFMGAALGWAFTQPAPIALCVFAALAIGFATPFVAVVLVPGVLERLPKPGPWMVRFKELTAFPMFATAAWLAWVFAHQTGPDGLARLLAACIAVGFCVWLWRVTGRVVLRAAGASLALALSGWALSAPPAPLGAVAAAETGALAGEPWSQERVSELQAEGRVVFVNFTAAWCVTCKVNERVALSGEGLRATLKETNAAYLVGDWTNRDPEIAAALAAYGRSGVPLYLVFPGRAGAEPRVLPQLLTERAVASAISQAAR